MSYEIPLIPVTIAIASIIAALVFIGLLRRLFVFGRPDEWLLQIRNGNLVRAGIGLNVLRWPGDNIVRFTSTLQRVKFSTAALTSEHLGVTVEGFAMWGVLPDGDGPFRAYHTLGLADLENPPTDLRNRRHLLGAQQYRAFQTLFAACIQRLTARRRLRSLLEKQDELLQAITACIEQDADELGIRLEQVQVLAVFPTDSTKLEQLSAPEEAQLREQATRVTAETDERLEQLAILSQTKLANDKAQSELDREAFAIDRQVELQKRKLVAAQEQAELEQAELEAKQTVDLAQLEAAQTIKQARQEAQRAVQRQQDETEREHNAARLNRERDDLELELEQVRRKAEARHDAIVSITEAEESKSQAVREQQLAETIAGRVTEAFAALPVKEMQWTTWSTDAPLAGLSHAIAELRQALGSETTPSHPPTNPTKH